MGPTREGAVHSDSLASSSASSSACSSSEFRYPPYPPYSAQSYPGVPYPNPVGVSDYGKQYANAAKIVYNPQHKPVPALNRVIADETKMQRSATVTLSREDEQVVKCVLIGDDTVGKTSLIVSYTTNGYPKEYVPTAFDNYSVVVKVNNRPVRLQLCDTAGQSSFDALRPLCYPDTDIVLLCFSVVSPSSFYNLAEHWLPEFRQHCPDAPILLIGTQADLRNDVRVLVELDAYGECAVSESEAQAFAQEICALQYIESSALTQNNLKEVFDAALCAGLRLPVGQPLDSPGPMQKIREKFRRTPSNHQFSSENYGVRDKNGGGGGVSSHVMLKRQMSNQKLHQVHIQEKQLPDKPKKGWKKLLCNVFRPRPNV